MADLNLLISVNCRYIFEINFQLVKVTFMKIMDTSFKTSTDEVEFCSYSKMALYFTPSRKKYSLFSFYSYKDRAGKY